MGAATKQFTIENTIYPKTKLPFGKGFRGVFEIRRASLMDLSVIDYKMAAERNAYGLVDAAQLNQGLQFASKIFHTVETLAVRPAELPPWFDRTQLTDDDEDQAALFAVWQEVDSFLKSFRSGNSGNAGGETGQQSAPVVPPVLQDSPA